MHAWRKLLPRHHYPVGLDQGGWGGSTPVRFPKNTVMSPANWTLGWADKHNLAALAREEIARRATAPLVVPGK